MCLAIPGKIISITAQLDETFRMGKVSFGGIMKEINLCMVPEAAVNDYVLVHVGVAISKVDEEEAHKTFEYLKQIGELEELKDKELNEVEKLHSTEAVLKPLNAHLQYEISIKNIELIYTNSDNNFCVYTMWTKKAIKINA